MRYFTSDKPIDPSIKVIETDDEGNIKRFYTTRNMWVPYNAKFNVIERDQRPFYHEISEQEAFVIIL